jgi:hypothetical protein
MKLEVPVADNLVPKVKFSNVPRYLLLVEVSVAIVECYGSQEVKVLVKKAEGQWVQHHHWRNIRIN